MAALITSRRHADFCWGKFVREPKKSAVRTRISAKAFLAQKVHRHETADEKKGNCYCDRRERLPKIRGHQMVGEIRENWRVTRVPKEAICRGPDKHVQRSD